MTDIIVFPNISPTTVDHVIDPDNAVNTSPLSRFTQANSRVGNRVGLRQSFVNLQGDDRYDMQAFLLAMNGQANRALMPDHSYHGPRGAIAGSAPVVDGAGQTGFEINITGLLPSITNIFKGADQFSFQNANGLFELKFVSADVDSDGSGNATVPIWPEIHHSPPDAGVIYTVSPAGTFMLVNPKNGWSNSPDGDARGGKNPNLSNFSLDWIEDMR